MNIFDFVMGVLFVVLAFILAVFSMSNTNAMGFAAFCMAAVCGFIGGGYLRKFFGIK